MKKSCSVLLSLLLICILLPALGESSIIAEGTVVSTQSLYVTSPAGGTVASVSAAVGAHVAEGATLATLSPTIVYAQQAGRVAVFGKAGQDAQTVAGQYGSVVSVEPTPGFTVSASISSDLTDDQKIIHVGEVVYLRWINGSDYTGKGIITAVTTRSFTVDVTEGTLRTGYTFNVYRKSAMTAASLIGSGKASGKSAVAYSSEGILFKMYVKNGATVAAGDPLYATLDAAYTGSTPARTITAPAAGIVAAVSCSAGGSLAQGGTVVELWPDSAMRMECHLSSQQLAYTAVGDKVTIRLEDDTALTGKVLSVSALPDDQANEEGETTWTVTLRLSSTEGLRYGMRGTVTFQK